MSEFNKFFVIYYIILMYRILSKYFSGIYRLEQIHQVINKKRLQLDVEAVRLQTRTDNYAALRHIDSRTERDKRKCIVLDLVSPLVLRSILTQVNE